MNKVPYTNKMVALLIYKVAYTNKKVDYTNK